MKQNVPRQQSGKLPLVICDSIIGDDRNFPARVLDPEAGLSRCCGCFDCWLKTPTQCRFPDRAANMGQLLSECSELILISRCAYGGYSPFVKTVLERCLSYVLPLFRLGGKRSSHRSRFRSPLVIRNYFYGEDILPEERETAELLCREVAFDLSAKESSVQFFPDAETALCRAKEDAAEMMKGKR